MDPCHISRLHPGRRENDSIRIILLTRPPTEKSLEAAKSKFNNILTAIRMLLTKAPQYFVPFWYAKEPMFWLPHGWFPYYAEWIISFPRAPLGSVSVASWQLACSGFIALLADLISGIYGLVVASRVSSGGEKRKEAPVKAAPVNEKKEL